MLKRIDHLYLSVSNFSQSETWEIHKNKSPALLKRITDYAHDLPTKAGDLFTGKCPFYDLIMQELGQHKGDKVIAEEPHAHYFGPQFQLTIRPARSPQKHDPYAPGLHHLCFQVETMTEVDLCFEKLKSLGIEVSQPKQYPEYHPEYYAIFFDDPDGIRLEIVAKTSARQALELQWNELKEFLNPLQALPKNEFITPNQVWPLPLPYPA